MGTTEYAAWSIAILLAVGCNDDDHQMAAGDEHSHGEDAAESPEHDNSDGHHSTDAGTAQPHLSEDAGGSALCRTLASVCHSANMLTQFQHDLYKDCHEVGHRADAIKCEEAETKCLEPCLSVLMDAGVDLSGAHNE